MAAAPTVPVTTTGAKPPLTIAQRITKPSAALNYVVATVYGKGGVGKTTLLGTMPGRGLVLDIPQVEGGTFVIADKADRIDVLLCTEWKDFRDIFIHLRDNQHNYQWVAIDSITAAQTLAKRKTIKDRDMAADPHTITMQDWGKIGELDAQLYYSFCTLPMHVIFVAQEKLKDQDDGSREYQPDVSPASLAALQPRQMVIGRLYTREVDGPDGASIIERRLRVQPHARAIAKVRTLPSRPVPATIKDPDLGRLFGYILGAKVKAPEAARDETLGVIEIG